MNLGFIQTLVCQTQSTSWTNNNVYDFECDIIFHHVRQLRIVCEIQSFRVDLVELFFKLY